MGESPRRLIPSTRETGQMPVALKPVLAGQIEINAGFLGHTDHHAGRGVDAIDDLGIFGDTLILYLIGDN